MPKTIICMVFIKKAKQKTTRKKKPKTFLV